MATRGTRLVLAAAVALTLFQAAGFAQESGADRKSENGGKGKDLKITKVIRPNKNNQNTTQIEIDLQNAPDNMEPVAEPLRIRIDDRSNVRMLLTNLSPLDVCTRTASPPTPTTETPVAESLVTTIAGLGGTAIGTSTAELLSNAPASERLSQDMYAILILPKNAASTRPPPGCKVQSDPEYEKLMTKSKEFFPAACGIIGGSGSNPQCNTDSFSQVELAHQIDVATERLANFAGADYRGLLQRNFLLGLRPDEPGDLQEVRDAYTRPLQSIADAGQLQATVDEMVAWAADLHKKYDYMVPTPDSGSPGLPPAVPGALTVSPTVVPVSPASLKQIIQLTAGGQPGTFTATPTSDTGWLYLSNPATTVPPTNAAYSGSAPDRGTLNLMITIDPNKLDVNATHYGSITIVGTGAAKGTTIVNVVFKPASGPSDCDLEALLVVDKLVDGAKAQMSLLSDNNKALETAQAGLKTSYMALVKVRDDYARRYAQKIVVQENGILEQNFNLGTDRKDTSVGYISCVSDVDGKTPTTTNINYTLLYQDVPHWSASAGFLTSFLPKKIVGIVNENTPGSSPPANMQVFGITDRAQAQLIPMAFVNYRIAPYKSTWYGKTKEDELVWTTNVSAGFGINPNTGTNQPEFFFGIAEGMNHFMFHAGVHFGRVQNLTGGYNLNDPVPSGLTTAPISWSYQEGFSLGFSVRLAPY